MLALGIVAALFAAAAIAPQSPLGEALIRRPARALADLTWRRAVVGLLALAVLAALVAGGPEMVALVGMADLSLLAEVAALALLTGAAARLRIVAQTAVVVARRIVAVAGRRPRLRRRRVRRSPRSPHAPDLPGWAAWAWA